MTTETAILAIDQGTTSSRALVFDLSGNVVATAQKELTQHYPADGWVEHDAEEIWTDTLAMCRQALAEASAKASAAAPATAPQRKLAVAPRSPILLHTPQDR